MRYFLIIGLFFVLSVKEVFTDSENEIKRGTYPFLAILYYQDKSILGPSGARFARTAVLVKKEWLISSSLETNDTQLAFPRKTLIARAGAIRIDANFTYNEDEDEQEREIIKIIRPTNFSAASWWYNDISLLKTLLPFNITTAVATTTVTVKPDIDKSCYILVFVKKYKKTSDEKLLMQLSVELSPSSNENCGTFFRNETMICASENDENKNVVYDSDFCDGNGGGPLMCEGDVIGLQTYIGNNCKAPYLYQSLSAWDDFISCSVKENFMLQQCANTCEVIEKDTIITNTTNKVTTLTTKEAKDILMELSIEDTSNEHFLTSETTKQSTATESDKPTPTTSDKVEITTITTVRTPVAITEHEDKFTRFLNSQTGWVKDKFAEHRKKLDDAEDSDKIERKTNVEAQLHEAKNKGRNTAVCLATGKTPLFHSLSFGGLFQIVYYLI